MQCEHNVNERSFKKDAFDMEVWKVGNAGNGVNEFQYLNLLIMPAHKKSYHVSYANNICVSLLHASSNKTLPTIFTFVLLLIQKNKAYT